MRYGIPGCGVQGRDTELERFLAKNQLYSNETTKGPAAKKAMRKNPGYFNQILTFESRKWSPVATFESKNN